MRLIDADALIKSIKNTADLGGWIGAAVYHIKQVAIKYIDDAPSIDIEPKRGVWIEFDTKWGRSLYYCTNCMETTEVPTAFGNPLYDFCPKCGADMREREGK